MILLCGMSGKRIAAQKGLTGAEANIQQTVLVDSQGLPPALEADNVLRLAESGVIVSQRFLRILTQRATAISEGLSDDGPLFPDGGTQTDTEEAYQTAATAMRVDAISIELRAARLLAPVDATGARSMLLEAAEKRYHPIACDRAVHYDFSGWSEAYAATEARLIAFEKVSDARAVIAHLSTAFTDRDGGAAFA